MKKPHIILIAVALLAVTAYLLIGRGEKQPGREVQTTKETAAVADAAAGKIASMQNASGTDASKQAPEKAATTTGVNTSSKKAQVSPAATAAAAKATNTYPGAGGAEVALSIGGKEVSPGAPNVLGVFPRQNIEIGASVPVRVVFPKAGPGDSIIAAVTDGGQLTGNKPGLPLTLDAGRAASFTFTGSREPGLFRVTLRRGMEVKTLEFWAGPEPRFVSVQQPPPPSRR